MEKVRILMDFNSQLLRFRDSIEADVIRLHF